MNRLFSFRLCAAAVLFLSCAVADAQDISHPYVMGGISGEWRDPGSANRDPGTDNSQFGPAVMISIGRSVLPWLGIEGSVDLAPSREFSWRYTYFDAATLNRASHRDLLVLGCARFRLCQDRLCAEPVAGVGLAIHHAESFVTASCGSLSLPTPCTPVSQSAEPNDVSDAKIPTVSLGVDLLFRATSHISFGPAARLYLVPHDIWLFPAPDGPDHRGPSGAGGRILALGFVTKWN